MDRESAYFLICIFSAFPLTALFNHIRNPAAKHYFSITTSMTLFLMLYSLSSLMHMLIASLYVYAITATVGSYRASPILCFVLLLAQMSYIHLGYQLIEQKSHSFDQSSSFMVLLMKLSSYAWSVFDGHHNNLAAERERREVAIKKIPPLLEFFGFVFFFLSVWVGPAFEFKVYQAFVNEIPPFNKNSISTTRIYQTFLIGISALVLHLFLTAAAFSFTDTIENKFNLSLIPRLFQIYGAALAYRLKYVGAWKLTESACGNSPILTTLATTRISYNGIDPKTNQERYDRAENINVTGVELAENMKMLTENWNKYTHLWLKRAVYSRIDDGKNKNFASFATYLISGFWHGFKPGYYLSFISAALVNASARSLRQNIRPLFAVQSSPLAKFKCIYDYVGILTTMITISYVMVPAGIWEFEPSLKLWRETYFFGHVVCILSLLLGMLSDKKTNLQCKSAVPVLHVLETANLPDDRKTK